MYLGVIIFENSIKGIKNFFILIFNILNINNFKYFNILIKMLVGGNNRERKE